MAIDPENWLVAEQMMEDDNHVLLQVETTEETLQQQPQLLMISAHAVQGISSTATFSVIVCMGSKRGIALIDSGSSDTFMDYTFAARAKRAINKTPSQKVKVAGGGHLDTDATTAPSTYQIQNHYFSNQFKLLPLRGYDIIFGCDWIK
jgi:hypothetical protein